MSIIARSQPHPALDSLDLRTEFRFYDLADATGVYAAMALAEHPDALELHLEMLRFGPATVRSLRIDVEELKDMARQLGKSRIVGLKTEPGPGADLRWPKFTRLFGFTGQRVIQAAELRVD